MSTKLVSTTGVVFLNLSRWRVVSKWNFAACLTGCQNPFLEIMFQSLYKKTVQKMCGQFLDQKTTTNKQTITQNKKKTTKN